ncbi:flagellar biosynthetic protein FliO [Kineococcus sp. R8]|uniref:flagellar biosynthetic protein FliO n=1 Tax=Kineococcus siccus TaxID=2696567 RepID=UPI0014131273|nr:flagellar biosynthetic protein FliO [Kineococcus siccus]NAZ84218.1 flagellar biosynthetic protein FliO [Kineococcus siccus]
MDTLEALARMSVSLVAVLGLLFLVTRWLRRSKGAAAASGDIAVISRQAVGHKAGVAVLRVGERALVVGVTEHQVTLLSEMPAASIAPAPAETRDVVEIPLQPRTRPAAPPAGRRAAAPAELPPVHDAPAVEAPEALSLAELVDEHELERQLRGRDTTAPTGALAGSALSPATWTRAVDVLRERSTRR